MKLYRFEDRVYSTVEFDVGGGEHYSSTPVKVELLEYEVVKETPKGYWLGWPFSRTWVSKHAKKRFAYPTKEQALQSFKLRKKRQSEIHQARMNRALCALELANNFKLS